MSHQAVVRLGWAASSCIAVAVLALAGCGQEIPHEDPTMSNAAIAIPTSIRAEHEEIHEQLVAATNVAGRVGEAARALAALLHPHFVREEQIALPPLGLLAALARGEVSADMSAVLAMTDSLRAELPRMLEEHKAIHAATLHLGEVAQAEQNMEVAHLASSLALHARSEEEVFYPAALLVGDLVRARMREK